MPVDGNARRVVLLVGTISILAVLALGGLSYYADAAGPGGDGDRPDPKLVQPQENGSELWPYTSRTRGFDTRTLALNVVAVGDPDRVESAFRRQVEANWTTQPDPTTPENETVQVPEITSEEVVWMPAEGARRYAYVRSPDGTGHWLAESYQLYDGSYLGARHHVRAYQAPNEDWTAMQAHREYWDWFRLRHTVTSIADTQQYVDQQFFEDPRIEDVSRVYMDNGDSADGDGWVTVLEFAGLAGLVLGAGRRAPFLSLASDVRERFSPAGRAHTGRILLLFGAVLALYVGVRLGGVVLEGVFAGVSPKVVAAFLYPVLAFGLPIAAHVLSRPLPPEDAFVAAIAGVLAAFVLEYGYLSLSVIPVDLLLHRVALLLSFGLLAAASARKTTASDRDRHTLLAFGVAGWILTLGLPLLGLI